MKSFYNIGSQYSDVVILDESSSELIKHCIPKELSIKVLKIRSEIPLVYSLSFFVYFIRRIFQFGINKKSLYIAIIDCIDPKVLISFIDNSPIMSMMNNIFPNKLVISIQNGIRTASDIDYATNFGNYSLPSYFAFGKYEHALMIKNKTKFKNYYSSGSLKMGIFLSEKSKINLQPLVSKSICFISEYVDSYVSSSDKSKNDFIKLQKELFSYVVLWCNKNNYGLKVILRKNSKHISYENEVNFFRSNRELKKVTFFENNPDKLSSYKNIFGSDMIIALDSALAIEFFSQGHKVLFCPVYKIKTLRNIQFQEYLSNLPDINILKDLDINLFNKKMNKLLYMNNNEYYYSTEHIRGEYMNYGEPYAHEIISKFITAELKSE